MDTTKLAAAALAVLVAAVGGGAALTGAQPMAATAQVDDAGAQAGDATGPRDVDVTTTYDDGTVTVSVTSDGAGVENVTVEADDGAVGTTDADGTVTFRTDATEELELELEKGAFEGSVEYQLRDGSLTLVEEEYEYGELNEDADDDDADGDDERDEADDDERDEADENKDNDDDEDGDDEEDDQAEDADDDDDEDGDD